MQGVGRLKELVCCQPWSGRANTSPYAAIPNNPDKCCAKDDFLTWQMRSCVADSGTAMYCLAVQTVRAAQILLLVGVGGVRSYCVATMQAVTGAHTRLFVGVGVTASYASGRVHTGVRVAHSRFDVAVGETGSN